MNCLLRWVTKCENNHRDGVLAASRAQHHRTCIPYFRGPTITNCQRSIQSIQCVYRLRPTFLSQKSHTLQKPLKNGLPSTIPSQSSGKNPPASMNVVAHIVPARGKKPSTSCVYSDAATLTLRTPKPNVRVGNSCLRSQGTLWHWYGPSRAPVADVRSRARLERREYNRCTRIRLLWRCQSHCGIVAGIQAADTIARCRCPFSG